MNPWSRGVLVAVAVAAGTLRVTGWDRGVSDFVLPEASSHGETTSFYHYHPDETTLIGASLALDDPTQPPLTAYGMLPMYLGRAVLEGTAWLTGEPVDSDALSVRTVRAVSALLSLATLATMWALARNLWGAPTALVAVLLVGATPLAIQQAHFYTVDGLFALLALLSLGAVIRLHDGSRESAYLVAGLLIGATAATRLNGLLTALVLAVAHFTALRVTGWQGLSERFRAKGLWYAALTTVVTVVVLQPHLLIDPESMLRSSGTDDFAYSVAIASGDMLRPWSLADTDTIPYLHFWIALWPQGVGWPLTLLLALGWFRAVAQGERADRLIALWCALYFLTVGGLHTKHVRYLLPLLAPLGLLATRMVIDLCEHPGRRRWIVAVVAACALYTWAYGVAFSRIYGVEDARITAGRWIHRYVPEGSTIAIERGGFSMRGSFSASTYQEQDLNTSTVFSTRGYLSCGAAADYLVSRLEWAGWVAITDVNRYRQYTAATGLYPVLSSFYTALLDGGLGFEPVQRFKVYPRVAGWTFRDDDAEPSFLGFDHPAVLILRQGADHRAVLAAWQNAASELPGCADADLHAAARALEAGDLAVAEEALAGARESEIGLAHLLQVMVHQRRGEGELARLSMESFSAGAYDRSLSALLLPWAAAASLVELGLIKEAVRILELAWERRLGLEAVDKEIMSKSYLYVGLQLSEVGRVDLEERAYLMAADLWESPLTLNPAAKLVQDRGDAKTALALWEKSLDLDAGQIHVHVAAGNAAGHIGDRDRALHHLSRVVELTLAVGASSLDAVILTAQDLHRVGEVEKALDYLHEIAIQYPEWVARLQATAEDLTGSP